MPTVGHHILRALRLGWSASRTGFLGSLGLALVSAAIPPLVVWTTKAVIDLATTARGAIPPAAEWAPLAFGLGIAMATQRILHGLQANNEQRFAERVSRHADRDFLLRVATATMYEIEDPEWQDRTARAARELRSRPLNLIRGVIQLVTNGVASAGLIGVLLTLHPMLLVLASASVLTTLPFVHFHNRQMHRLFFATTTKERERYYVRSLLLDTPNAKEVRAFGLVSHLLRRYDTLVLRWYLDFLKVSRRSDRLTVFAGTVSGSFLAVAFAFGVWRALTGGLTAGSIAATIGAVTLLNSQATSLAQAIVNIGANASFVEDYFNFLDASHPRTGPTRVARRLAVSEVEFKDVSFTYPGAEAPALNNVSFRIREGEIAALVGENGAGKTTIVKLLLRFYDPSEGKILVDGLDLREIDPDEWRRHAGALFQDFVTYAFTLRESVWLGRPERPASDLDAIGALDAVHASHLIDQLPRGLGSNVARLFTGGQDLSGGERQRLALSRLVHRNAALWILDEPTAALDPRGEAAIFAELRTALTGKIAFLISHRFSTVKLSNPIIVLERGKIVEVGSHRELLAAQGLYAELFELQAAGYR